MWNYHRIRGKKNVHGHGGGIPAEMYMDPVVSETVIRDDARCMQAQGSVGAEFPGKAGIVHDPYASMLAAGVDVNGRYGAEEHAKGRVDRSLNEQEVHSDDPLGFDPFLQCLRSDYMELHGAVVDYHKAASWSDDWDKMLPHVQKFLVYKEACVELRALALDFGYDWYMFDSSSSIPEYSAAVQMRSALWGLARTRMQRSEFV